MSGPFLVEEFHRSRKPAPLTNLLVHGQSVYDKRAAPKFHVWAVLVEEFHRSRKPAPLTNLLVHGQSVYDKRPHHKFHVWAVLSRRVPPFSETSTAHQSARARSVGYDKRLPHLKFHVWAVLSRRVPPFSETSTAHQSARARSSVYDKRLPHKVSCLGRSKSKSSTVLGNQHRSPICSCTVSRFMISGCRTQFHVWAVLSRRVPPFSETSTAHQSARARSHRSPICSCTVSRLMISGCTWKFMSGPFLVEEFHRSRKPAPLTNLLVHGQSVYDKRLPHPKFHVWAVLSRRVPPFSETSTAHQSARARRFMISGCRTQFHVWAVLSRRVPPFSETSTAHQSARARSSVYDKRLPHLKFHVWAVLSRRVPPFSETSTAHQSARARSVGL
ncbi:hypothetical protein EVAR_70302_1 [Eumeta japonica]|uniref:Uncharacterized protein n=1 Tax=Eumeta variegata TaxID=151549 RepID=A0A4C2A4V9_EUMVA|nr:hypothetical protein EVAR_70302_1 [Eumeta japonica]